MFLSIRGQALIETCITLPVDMIILHSLVGLIVVTTNFYLADYWTYQSSLCLASQGGSGNCKDELKRNLSLLPLVHYNIKSFLKTSSQTFVAVDFNTMGVWPTTFQERLNLPLKGKDFHR